MKMWGGRFQTDTNARVLDYTSSIRFDVRLVEADINGSIAHAKMLGACGILPEGDVAQIVMGLCSILEDVGSNKLEWSIEDEDIHMNVERELTRRIGSVAGKLHTGRSRNDQVALDMHLYMTHQIAVVQGKIRDLQQTLIAVAQENFDVMIPGYTHLQRAQPILFSHHMLAYFWMFERDYARFADCKKRTQWMPLGAGALAGTTFPIDRTLVQKELGFAALYENSLDAVSDRDYLVEFLSASSLLMMHLSKIAEEIILWTSEEFGFVELADEFTTGSSMMPQKKNPDVAELVRGKTGRVYGNLMGLLTVLKGLPLAYNKDLQEDKEGVFDTLDTLVPALELFSDMLVSMTVKRTKLLGVFGQDFTNATDAADYLVRKGLPFREAHEVIGKLVLLAIQKGTDLRGLTLAEFQAASAAFEDDVFTVLSVEQVVGARNSRGGTAPLAVQAQLKMAKEILA